MSNFLSLRLPVLLTLLGVAAVACGDDDSGTGPDNTPPAVTLTRPTTDTSAAANTVVLLAATAADADGTVLAVDFRDGTTVIGTDSTSPYAFEWTPTINGDHLITARATDNDGSVTISAGRIVTVSGGTGDVQAPSVAWTAPAERASGLEGAINLTANADDNIGVAAVEFAVDGESLGEVTSEPYHFSLPATSAYTTGSHFLQVRARDAAGNTSDWAIRHVTFGGDEDLPAGFARTIVANGLSNRGTAMALAPDGRFFVCQQNGQLRVIKDGSLLPTPFVALTVNSDSERGLLGVAFDPDYANNGYVYVYYTTDSAPIHNRVSRFTASAANQDVAEAGSELPILELPQLNAGNHNGGAIHFGPDGKLYVAVGENAVGSNSQSLSTRLGKMLRINADGSIPTDNPFYATASDSNRAIWAMGLRNPFTFAFQPGTGRMQINDVGEATWEEINLGAAGANYGWPQEEGRETNPTYESPMFAYKHSQAADNPSMMTGSVITGGAFYNPSTVMFPPHYVGSYFFADLESHWIGRLDLGSGEAHHFARNTETVDMVVGLDGALYTLSNTGPSWGIFRYARP
jgi:glucose/arabinose dehydrogenase